MRDDHDNQPLNDAQNTSELKPAVSDSIAPNDRRQQIRLRLAEIGRAYQQSTIEVATLLEEVHRYRYWQDAHPTFKRYVEEEVGIPLRTAQELLRVIRACQKAGVSTSEIARLGWSKLAVVARQLTAENAEQLKKHVEDTSYSDLKREAKETREQNSSADSADDDDRIQLTHAIQRALTLASRHTHTTEIQHNLEFIAKTFSELCPAPSRTQFNPSLN